MVAQVGLEPTITFTVDVASKTTEFAILLLSLMHGGKRGIRTLGTGLNQFNGLANRRFRPTQPSFQKMEHLIGFEPTTF